jgi:cysteine desulfurase family protein (TIGR01976 family)
VLADNAGGTQVPRETILAISEYLASSNAQQGGTFARKIRTTEMLANARAAHAELLGVAPERISFGANSTSIAFDLARAISHTVRAGDRVVVTDTDHYANVIPWTSLSRFGAAVDAIPVDARGELDERAFADALAREPILVALPWASNGTGNVFDVARLAEAAKDAGAMVVVDAVQAAPHVPLDIPPAVDAVFFSLYKVYGPHLGALYAHPELAERFFTADDSLLPSAGLNWSMETGTQSFEGLAGWLGTMAYLRELGDGDARTAIVRIAAFEDELARYALARFAEREESVVLYGRPASEARLPVFAFNLRGVAPDVVASALASNGIEAALGDYYTPRLMRTLAPETGGIAVRLSFSHYNDIADIDRCFAAIDAARERNAATIRS